jgi:hypothetical protein
MHKVFISAQALFQKARSVIPTLYLQSLELGEMADFLHHTMGSHCGRQESEVSGSKGNAWNFTQQNSGTDFQGPGNTVLARAQILYVTGGPSLPQQESWLDF